ncbi:MAG: RecX family transcriptional regulator, partial [Muribaculaceae bacterium]|nr:RecX family transcriptional regulator [Muribaculaceae bacterium]
CARAEHSTGEMDERLRRWQIGSAETERILASLKAHRFVDDRRFARAYVTDKVKFARWGKRKVYQGLLNKRVAPEIIREALSDIDGDLYESTLEGLLRAKAAANKELLDTYEGRTKLFRFAASRGFEPQLCSTVLHRLIEQAKE